MFRFHLVFLMPLFTLLWNKADRFYRYMQPLAGMSVVAPGTSNSLLDYPT